jgi:UrcA family protein
MNARISTLTLLTVPALLAFSTSALAADQQAGEKFAVPVSVVVDATGLDLSSPSGAERLYRQIVGAAESACGGPPSGSKGITRRNHETRHIRPCVERAVRAALEQVAAVTGHDLEQVAGRGASATRVAASR